MANSYRIGGSKNPVYFDVKGDMAKLIRDYSWAGTCLGAINEWPQSMVTAINIILMSPAPMVTLWGKEGIMIYNDAYSQFAANRHPQGLGGQVIHVWPEAATLMHEVLQVCLNGGSLSYQDLPYKVYRKGVPEDIFLDVMFSPILNEHGEPSGVLVINIETTSKIQALEELKQQRILQESEERFRSMADQAPVAIFMADAQGKPTYKNQNWLDFTGQTTEQGLDPEGWREVVHPDDHAKILETYTRSFQQRVTYSIEVRLLRRDRQYRYFLFTGGPRYFPNGEFEGFIGSGVDITDRKMVEYSLNESESRFRLLADQLPQFVWMTSESPAEEIINVSYANKYFLNYLGLVDYQQFLGNAWQGSIHPEDIQKVYDVYVPACKARLPYAVECRFKEAATSVYRWFMILGVPRYSVCKKFEGYVGSGIDIHENKLMYRELELKNEQLIRVNEDLDNFVYTASHDLKSPISNIEGLINSLGLIMDAEQKDPETPLLMEHIKSSVQRFKTTIQGLTEVTKVQRDLEEDVCEVDLESLLHDIQILIKDVISESQAQLKYDIPCKSLRFSKRNLQSMLYNLISNSIKYCSPDRLPKITIRCHEHQGCFRLEVEDNGLGIPAQQIDHIFKMFKRAHQHVEGSGIGLYLVKKMVENAGGKVTVESQVGIGSKFIIYLKLI